jgi:hypothetical protein
MLSNLLILSTALAGTLIPAQPAINGVVPVQGHLTDASGLPIDGDTDVTFTLYAGTDTLWSDQLTVDVVDGSFTVYLGDGDEALDLRMFADNPAVELGVAIGTDAELGRIELAHAAYAAYAEVAGEAEMLGGYTARDLRAPQWGAILGRPAGLDDGDDVLSQAQVEAWARGVCYDNASELPASVTNWSDIQGRPAGLDDGDQVRTQAEVEAWARGVAYDDVSELTSALDGLYLEAGSAISWDDIQGRPALTDPLSIDDVEQTAIDAVRERGVGRMVYLEDDEPEATLDNSLSRLHISVSAANYGGRTKPIPHDMFVDLCGDPDGCEVRVGMTRWSDDTQTQTASWGSQMRYYSPSDGNWRMSQPKAANGAHPEYVIGTNETDGDGNIDHLLSVWHTCYITDGEYDAYQGLGDSGPGIQVLVWNTYTNPGRTCEFTFID